MRSAGRCAGAAGLAARVTGLGDLGIDGGGGIQIPLYRGIIQGDRGMTRQSHPRGIVITGASSGIGAALALDYAAPGVSLALVGRNAARLDRQADACRGKGATVECLRLDVTDGVGMAAGLAAVDDRMSVDLVIANAGLSGGTSGVDEGEAQTRAILAVNLDGVLNTIQPLIPRMCRRRRGQVAVMSSLAAFRGMAGAPAYCASKAAVRLYGEGLRLRLAPQGVSVSVICPGFVRSAMTQANDWPMPLLMDADKAARIIRRGLARNRGRIAFPWPMYLAVSLVAALPPAWTDRLLKRPPETADG